MAAMLIPRLENAGGDFIRSEYIEQDRPCILAAYANWPAMVRWSCAHLKRLFGDERVLASRSASHIHPDLSRAPLAPPTIKVRFADYLTLVWSGTAEARHLFVIGDNLAIYDKNATSSAPSPLSSDIQMPPLIDERRLQFIGFWLSAQGTESCLHYDANGCHNLNVQVGGSKRVVLISPDECAHLYVYPATKFPEAFRQFSQVNPFSPHHDRFPLFSNAKIWTGTLEKGDALYIPAYWFHAFQHQGNANINVNYWWTPSRHLVNATTAREIFLAALAKELGCRSATSDAIASLGMAPETVALLTRLEHAMTKAVLRGSYRAS